MDRFGPTGKVSKKRVHLLRWSSFTGRTGWNFGWMDRALRLSNLNVCIEKSRCEMLIGGDVISNDVITLGTCFAMFAYIRACSPLCADLRKSNCSVDGEPQGNWRWNSSPRDVVANSPFFYPPPERLGKLARRLPVVVSWCWRHWTTPTP